MAFTLLTHLVQYQKFGRFHIDHPNCNCQYLRNYKEKGQQPLKIFGEIKIDLETSHKVHGLEILNNPVPLYNLCYICQRSVYRELKKQYPVIKSQTQFFLLKKTFERKT